jgi:serine/threonine-protein kinase ULK/ATG1
MLRKCKHENIVSLIDAKKTRNHLYIFMEYCEDGTLEDYIRTNKELSEGEAMQLFFQVTRGMQVLSVNKVIHRDLKPQNILIKHGVVKIADFGLAKKFMNSEFFQTFVGTPSHMAPEIIRGEPYTEKVDVYSAGAILYEMLYGAAPFQFCGDYGKLLKAKDCGMKQNKIVKISQKSKDLLKGMLEPNPENRINLNGVLDFMDEYNFQQREIRLRFYKKLSIQSLMGVGVVGSIICAMNMKISSSPQPPSRMDLRLYGKLCQRMTTVNN